MRIPDGVDDAAVRRALLDEFGIEIGGGLGPMKGKVWRIGLMGESSTEANVLLVLQRARARAAALRAPPRGRRRRRGGRAAVGIGGADRSAMGAARWLKRLALVPLGVALGLLALEALLQVAALAVHLGGGPTPAAWLTGNRRVLCLGDSNTYGLYLPDRAQAYPQTFEALWNERVASPRIEVLNLGYPGTNSSRLRRDLPRMLEAFAPDVVILMVGSNDYWTAPVDVAPSGAFARAAQSVKRHSRVYQLSYMLRRALSADRLEIDYDPRVNGGAGGHRALRRRRDSARLRKGGASRRCAIARSSRPICVR